MKPIAPIKQFIAGSLVLSLALAQTPPAYALRTGQILQEDVRIRRGKASGLEELENALASRDFLVKRLNDKKTMMILTGSWSDEARGRFGDLQQGGSHVILVQLSSDPKTQTLPFLSSLVGLSASSLDLKWKEIETGPVFWHSPAPTDGRGSLTVISPLPGPDEFHLELTNDPEILEKLLESQSATGVRQAVASALSAAPDGASAGADKLLLHGFSQEDTDRITQALSQSRQKLTPQQPAVKPVVAAPSVAAPRSVPAPGTGQGTGMTKWKKKVGWAGVLAALFGGGFLAGQALFQEKAPVPGKASVSHSAPLFMQAPPPAEQSIAPPAAEPEARPEEGFSGESDDMFPRNLLAAKKGQPTLPPTFSGPTGGKTAPAFSVLSESPDVSSEAVAVARNISTRAALPPLAVPEGFDKWTVRDLNGNMTNPKDGILPILPGTRGERMVAKFFSPNEDLAWDGSYKKDFAEMRVKPRDDLMVQFFYDDGAPVLDPQTKEPFFYWVPAGTQVTIKWDQHGQAKVTSDGKIRGLYRTFDTVEGLGRYLRKYGASDGKIQGFDLRPEGKIIAGVWIYEERPRQGEKEFFLLGPQGLKLKSTADGTVRTMGPYQAVKGWIKNGVATVVTPDKEYKSIDRFMLPKNPDPAVTLAESTRAAPEQSVYPPRALSPGLIPVKDAGQLEKHVKRLVREKTFGVAALESRPDSVLAPYGYDKGIWVQEMEFVANGTFPDVPQFVIPLGVKGGVAPELIPEWASFDRGYLVQTDWALPVEFDGPIQIVKVDTKGKEHRVVVDVGRNGKAKAALVWNKGGRMHIAGESVDGLRNIYLPMESAGQLNEHTKKLLHLPLHFAEKLPSHRRPDLPRVVLPPEGKLGAAPELEMNHQEDRYRGPGGIRATHKRLQWVEFDRRPIGVVLEDVDGRKRAYVVEDGKAQVRWDTRNWRATVEGENVHPLPEQVPIEKLSEYLAQKSPAPAGSAPPPTKVEEPKSAEAKPSIPATDVPAIPPALSPGSSSMGGGGVFTQTFYDRGGSTRGVHFNPDGSGLQPDPFFPTQPPAGLARVRGGEIFVQQINNGAKFTRTYFDENLGKVLFSGEVTLEQWNAALSLLAPRGGNTLGAPLPVIEYAGKTLMEYRIDARDEEDGRPTVVIFTLRVPWEGVKLQNKAGIPEKVDPFETAYLQVVLDEQEGPQVVRVPRSPGKNGDLKMDRLSEAKKLGTYVSLFGGDVEGALFEGETTVDALVWRDSHGNTHVVAGPTQGTLRIVTKDQVSHPVGSGGLIDLVVQEKVVGQDGKAAFQGVLRVAREPRVKAASVGISPATQPATRTAGSGGSPPPPKPPSMPATAVPAIPPALSPGSNSMGGGGVFTQTFYDRESPTRHAHFNPYGSRTGGGVPSRSDVATTLNHIMKEWRSLRGNVERPTLASIVQWPADFRWREDSIALPDDAIGPQHIREWLISGGLIHQQIAELAKIAEDQLPSLRSASDPRGYHWVRAYQQRLEVFRWFADSLASFAKDLPVRPSVSQEEKRRIRDFRAAAAFSLLKIERKRLDDDIAWLRGQPRSESLIRIYEIEKVILGVARQRVEARLLSPGEKDSAERKVSAAFAHNQAVGKLQRAHQAYRSEAGQSKMAEIQHQRLQEEEKRNRQLSAAGELLPLPKVLGATPDLIHPFLESVLPSNGPGLPDSPSPPAVASVPSGPTPRSPSQTAGGPVLEALDSLDRRQMQLEAEERIAEIDQRISQIRADQAAADEKRKKEAEDPYHRGRMGEIRRLQTQIAQIEQDKGFARFSSWPENPFVRELSHKLIGFGWDLWNLVTEEVVEARAKALFESEGRRGDIEIAENQKKKLWAKYLLSSASDSDRLARRAQFQRTVREAARYEMAIHSQRLKLMQEWENNPIHQNPVTQWLYDKADPLRRWYESRVKQGLDRGWAGPNAARVAETQQAIQRSRRVEPVKPEQLKPMENRIQQLKLELQLYAEMDRLGIEWEDSIEEFSKKALPRSLPRWATQLPIDYARVAAENGRLVPVLTKGHWVWFDQPKVSSEGSSSSPEWVWSSELQRPVRKEGIYKVTVAGGRSFYVTGTRPPTGSGFRPVVAVAEGYGYDPVPAEAKWFYTDDWTARQQMTVMVPHTVWKIQKAGGTWKEVEAGLLLYRMPAEEFQRMGDVLLRGELPPLKPAGGTPDGKKIAGDIYWVGQTLRESGFREVEPLQRHIQPEILQVIKEPRIISRARPWDLQDTVILRPTKFAEPVKQRKSGLEEMRKTAGMEEPTQTGWQSPVSGSVAGLEEGRKLGEVVDPAAVIEAGLSTAVSSSRVRVAVISWPEASRRSPELAALAGEPRRMGDNAWLWVLPAQAGLEELASWLVPFMAIAEVSFVTYGEPGDFGIFKAMVGNLMPVQGPWLLQGTALFEVLRQILAHLAGLEEGAVGAEEVDRVREALGLGVQV